MTPPIARTPRYDLDRLALGRNALSPLPVARGHLGRIVSRPDGIAVSGWMLLVDRPLDGFECHLDGRLVVREPIVRRDDIAEHLPSIAHASQSGIAAVLPVGPGEREQLSRLDLVGTNAGERVARMTTILGPDLDQLPSPSEELMYRVAHARDRQEFQVGGLKTFTDFVDALEPHLDLRECRRMLDWGCGVARMTRHFAAIENGPVVEGCDIDPEAIEWAAANVPDVSFAAIEPEPPTSYADASFDLVVGYSVFTHLERNAQRRWLAEIARLLSPGGVFAATVSGELSGYVRREVPVPLPPEGISDSTLDRTLDGVAPAGYYRATHQNRAYTERVFGEQLDVVAYLEGRMAIVHDLVIMRKG